jgi:hypothetical protein
MNFYFTELRRKIVAVYKDNEYSQRTVAAMDPLTLCLTLVARQGQ